MFIPLHDAKKLEHIDRQYVTLSLIAFNITIFVITGLGSDALLQASAFGMGYIPIVLHDGQPAPPFLFVPEIMTYITYAFLHGDLLHLGGNMLFLWVFGDNVEDAFGHFKFFLFYMVSAVAGAFLHGWFLPESSTPLIGASGAVAGVVTAYLILHPKVRIWVLVMMRIPLRLPAYIPLFFWISFQVVMLLGSSEEEISWAAHVGGIIAGSILVLILRRRGVPLFDRRIVTPSAVETEPAPGDRRTVRLGKRR